MNGSPVVRVSAASAVLKLNGCPPASESITSLSAAAWTISVRLASLVSSIESISSVIGASVAAGRVGEASSITGSSVKDASFVTGASVAAGAIGVDSTITGSSVSTGSSVDGKTSVASTGGGVASSANKIGRA